VATGSGSLHAGTVIKIGFRDGMSRDEAVSLCLNALFQAADSDSATGGPDLVRRIFPTVATITSDGFQRLGDDELAERFRSIVDDQTSAGGTEVTGA
jgi:proteasome beta subunit